MAYLRVADADLRLFLAAPGWPGMSHPLGAGLSLTVGVIASALTLLAFLAYRRNQDRRLLFVAGAFAAFALKGVLTFVDWATGFIGHTGMAIASSSLDLVVVMLLVAPFLTR